MKPRIQYVRTPDGVNIAYWVHGEGLPLVLIGPAPFSHLAAELDHPGFARWYEDLARYHRLVRFDPRGCGLSDRNPPSFSMEAFATDLDSVADRVGFETFAVHAISLSGPVAIAYAATRPERVSALLLWCTSLTSEETGTPAVTAIGHLRDVDYAMFTETLSHAIIAGFSAPEDARGFAAIMRAALAPGDPILAHALSFDATVYAPQVRARTLVMHRKEALLPTVDSARRLAAAIPGAELQLFEGGSLVAWVGDYARVEEAHLAFLGLERRAHPAAAPAAVKRPPGGLRTVLFTDLEGHTAMMQRLGDERGRAVLRDHERLIREALAQHGGEEVKTLGDGFMASFVSATAALQCAIAIQRALQGPGGAGGEALRVRVGINAGEPIEEEHDLFGAAVIAAARIAAEAKGGETLVTDVVRQLVAGKQFLFADRGTVALRGLDDPVRAWALRWEDAN